MNLRLRAPMPRGQLVDDVLGGPAASRHDDRAGSDFVEATTFRVGDDDVRRAGWISRVLDANDRGIEPQPCRLAGTIERAEAHRMPPHRVDGAWTRERVGN